MAFRSSSYTGLCPSAEHDAEEAKNKPQHTASVEHIDFRKAFDFADRCSREGSKSLGKLSAFKPVYVRRPMQPLHSFDSLSASAETVTGTSSRTNASSATSSGQSKKTEHLEGAAGELQRVFDQLAAQLEREANQLRKEASEKHSQVKQASLAWAGSNSGNSGKYKSASQEADTSLLATERHNRRSQNTCNVPTTSLKPPLSKGSTSPGHAKHSQLNEERRGSTGDCGASAWTKPGYSTAATCGPSASPVRERFAARRKLDSLEKERDVNISVLSRRRASLERDFEVFVPIQQKPGLDQERDLPSSLTSRRRTSLERDKDAEPSFVSLRKSVFERERDADALLLTRRRSSLDRDLGGPVAFPRRSSLDKELDGSSASPRRSSSRERAEARLAALQKLSASREKYEDSMPRAHRPVTGDRYESSHLNGSSKSEETLNSSTPSGERLTEVDGLNTHYLNKPNNVSLERPDRSPTREGFRVKGQGLFKSSSTSRVKDSPFNERIEKSGDIRLFRRSSSREKSPTKEPNSPKYSIRENLPTPKWSCSTAVDDLGAQSCPRRSSLSGVAPELDLDKDVSPSRQEGFAYADDTGSVNPGQDTSVSLLPAQDLRIVERSRSSLASDEGDADDDHPSTPDDVQTAGSVRSDSLSSSSESVASSDPEAPVVSLNFPQALDQVVSRCELEKRQKNDPSLNEKTLDVDDKPASASAETIHQRPAVKISNFFSDENLNLKKTGSGQTNGEQGHGATESKNRLFVNPELPGYVGFANLPNQVHRKSVKKGFEFTLMVVGESGLGKTTLVNSLFMTDIYPERTIPNAAERIQKTVAIQTATVEIEERGVRLRLTVVDTPGYGDALNSNDCFKSVIKYVDDQFAKYLADESGLNRKNIVDNRIHACFYFINPAGHGLKPLDISFMKAIHHKVNIVPVIAKADTLTKPELARLKKRVLEEIEENNIDIYKLPDCESDDDDESFKESCRELKAAVPFAVVGSNQVMDVGGHKVRARTYPWGVVEVENPDHCDFIKLRTMFITHMQDLLDVTHELHYENYRLQQLGASLEGDLAFAKQQELLLQARLLKEQDQKLLKTQEQYKQMQEAVSKQKMAADSKSASSSTKSAVSSKQHIAPAINGQANGSVAKKPPLVDINQM